MRNNGILDLLEPGDSAMACWNLETQQWQVAGLTFKMIYVAFAWRETE